MDIASVHSYTIKPYIHLNNIQKTQESQKVIETQDSTKYVDRVYYDGPHLPGQIMNVKV